MCVRGGGGWADRIIETTAICHIKNTPREEFHRDTFQGIRNLSTLMKINAKRKEAGENN